MLLIGSDCEDAYPVCPAIIHMCASNYVKKSCPKTCGACDIFGNFGWTNDYYLLFFLQNICLWKFKKYSYPYKLIKKKLYLKCNVKTFLRNESSTLK